jgi:NAD(P)H-dependent FMN reductase
MHTLLAACRREIQSIFSWQVHRTPVGVGVDHLDQAWRLYHGCPVFRHRRRVKLSSRVTPGMLRETELQVRIREDDTVQDVRTLSIPIILGTPRQGRLSEHVARVILEQASAREDVQTELIDIRQLPLATDDAGEQIKDQRFSDTILRADALIIVAPEYNHGYPGMLKHALDSNLKEYIHKPVGLCGVSAGGFGGTRVVESLLPVMRELGLVTIFWDLNVSSVGKTFDSDGRLLDDAIPRRSKKLLDELVWMARVLRTGREELALDAKPAVPCSMCGAPMNHHAEKMDFSAGDGGVLQQVNQCARCGNIELRATMEAAVR